MSQATLETPSASAPMPTPPGGASAPAPVMGYRTPQARKARPQINFRLITFLVLIAVPFVYFFYQFFAPMMSGGIIQHGDYSEVDLKALGNFPFDTEGGTLDDVPKRWKELDGKRVMLKGYMVSFRESGAKTHEFQFVYNVQKCCFGGPPLPQERVYGHNKAGVDLIDQSHLVQIIGTLHVRVLREKETGAIHSVFDMDTESCVPLDG